MNYASYLQDFIDEIKADKSLPQPLKNYIVSDTVRVQALCRAAMVTTGLRPPEGMVTGEMLQPASVCRCPEGGIRTDCPVHGTMG